MGARITLGELIDAEGAEGEGPTDAEEPAAAPTEYLEKILPIELRAIIVRERPSPHAFTNLKKLRRLGLLNGDVLLSLIAQAPIDPINLMSVLMKIGSKGWNFSPVDFTMFRVIAKKGDVVTAAFRVDLMGDTIEALVTNRAGQLTLFKSLKVEPRADMLASIEAFAVEAIRAAEREQAPAPKPQR